MVIRRYNRTSTFSQSEGVRSFGAQDLAGTSRNFGTKSLEPSRISRTTCTMLHAQTEVQHKDGKEPGVHAVSETQMVTLPCAEPRPRQNWHTSSMAQPSKLAATFPSFAPGNLESQKSQKTWKV